VQPSSRRSRSATSRVIRSPLKRQRRARADADQRQQRPGGQDAQHRQRGQHPQRPPDILRQRITTDRARPGRSAPRCPGGHRRALVRPAPAPRCATRPLMNPGLMRYGWAGSRAPTGIPAPEGCSSAEPASLLAYAPRQPRRERRRRYRRCPSHRGCQAGAAAHDRSQIESIGWHTSAAGPGAGARGTLRQPGVSGRAPGDAASVPPATLLAPIPPACQPARAGR
jgi:hypothetical protein